MGTAGHPEGLVALDRNFQAFRSELAACRGSDTEVFFAQQGQRARVAKRICEGCPVREECPEFAVVNNETIGVWGGSTPRERRQIRRERGLRAPRANLRPCGTPAAFYRHLAHGEEPCIACTEAKTAHESERGSLRRQQEAS